MFIAVFWPVLMINTHKGRGCRKFKVWLAKPSQKDYSLVQPEKYNMIVLSVLLSCPRFSDTKLSWVFEGL